MADIHELCVFQTAAQQFKCSGRQKCFLLRCQPSVAADFSRLVAHFSLVADLAHQLV